MARLKRFGNRHTDRLMGSMFKSSDILEKKVSKDEMPLRASVYSVLLCMLFGANTVAIKFSLTGLGPFTNAGIRFGIAVVVIYLWARFNGAILKITANQFRIILVLGFFFTAQMVCFYLGLNRTSASHGVLISNLLPFIVLVLAHIYIPGDSITLKKLIGITLGFSGVVFLFFEPDAPGQGLLSGDFVILLAVALWGVNVIYVKRVISQFNAIQITLYPMIMGVPLFFLMGYLFDAPMVTEINSTVIKSLFYQSVITASFGFVAWNVLLQKYGATVLHSFVFLMPVTGVFFGVWLLDEPVTIHLILSSVLIVIGILVVNIHHHRLPHP